MIANYHTHTRWCRHGTGEIEQYILRAIECGIEELAVTEHVPLPGDPDKKDRMSFNEFESFNAELDLMAERYKGSIRVLKGFECEYCPNMLETYRHYRERYGYEILILGQHVSIDRRRDNFFLTEPWQLVQYADEVCMGLKTGMFAFLAHPDMVIHGYKKVDEAMLRAMDRIFSVCTELGIPAEINANGMHTHRGYPSRKVWELARRYEILCLINSDAHNPEDMLSHVAECEALANDLGLRVLKKLPEQLLHSDL